MPPGEKKVITIGTFDLFHYGHVRFLRQCASFGELTVWVNTDQFCERVKRRPIMSEEERLEVVQALEFVQAVDFYHQQSDFLEWANKASRNVDILAVSSDWAKQDYYERMGFTEHWLDLRGIQLIYLPHTRGISTTEVIERCRSAP